MLLSIGNTLGRRLLLLPARQQLPQPSQFASLLYTWDNRGGAEGSYRRPNAGDEFSPTSDRQSRRDHNEIRLRGTISRIIQADGRVCRFLVTTRRLYQHVNPGGSWRWAEQATNHMVVGAGAKLPRYLPVLNVGARVDMSGIVSYQENQQARTGQASASNASLERGSADNSADAADTIATNRRAVLRLVWIRPVEEEELVDVNFNLHLADS